jgi:hypothetical protein
MFHGEQLGYSKFAAIGNKLNIDENDLLEYYIEDPDTWLVFARRGVDIGRYPAIREHLNNWKTELTPKKSSNDKVGRKPGRYEMSSDDVRTTNIDGSGSSSRHLQGSTFLLVDGRYLPHRYCLSGRSTSLAF